MDLIEDFSDGRIQFSFVKVKDPNSGLPKNVLIAWVRLSSFDYRSQPFRLLLTLHPVWRRGAGENERLLHQSSRCSREGLACECFSGVGNGGEASLIDTPGFPCPDQGTFRP